MTAIDGSLRREMIDLVGIIPNPIKSKGRDCSRPFCRLRIRSTTCQRCLTGPTSPLEQTPEDLDTTKPQPLHCQCKPKPPFATNQILPPPVLRFSWVDTSTVSVIADKPLKAHEHPLVVPQFMHL